MTRLAVLTDAVYPWHAGGKEMRQEQLLSRLARRGVDVQVYTMKWWSEPGPVVRNGVTYHAICPMVPLYRRERRSIRQAVIFSLCSLRLLRERFDRLEVDAIPVLQLFPAKAISLLRRRPLVATWHEFWGKDYWIGYLGGMRGTLAGNLEALAAGLADVTIAASDGTRERLTSLGGSDPTRTICVPNGFDGDSVLALTDVASPVAADLVVVGRLLAHKNVDKAIHALALLHQRGERLTLAVIGQGPERRSLERLAQDLGLGDFVVFTGALAEHSEVLAAMRDAKALVFPSDREGFGLVALEAMALGTPVVTTDHPDNFARVLIDHDRNGVLSPAEPARLAEAIQRVLAERVRMGAAAAKAAVDYDWDRVADRAVERIYV